MLRIQATNAMFETIIERTPRIQATSTNAMFETIIERALPWKVCGSCMSWCPTTDLCVFALEQGSIACFRLNGERVWQLNVRKESCVKRIGWLDNGSNISIVYEDGVFQIHQTSNGRPIGPVVDENVSVVAWASKNDGEEIQDDDGVGIASKDISNSLPKLPPLPQAKDAMGLITMIESRTDRKHETRVLIAGTSSGELSINLYGVFSIGKVALKNGIVKELLVSRDLTMYFGLVHDDHIVSLVALQGNFMSKFGPRYLPEVSLNPAHILALVAYISKAVAIVEAERTTVVKHTTMFLAALARTLSGLNDENDRFSTESAVQTELFEYVLKGRADDLGREWIEDVHEKGLKRWYKAVAGAYEAARSTLFEYIVPALTKALVLLSHLRGLARWQQRGSALGLTASDVSDAIEKASVALKATHRSMWALSSEIEAFRAFSTWVECLFESTLGRSLGGGGDSVRTADVLRYVVEYLPEKVFHDVDVSFLESNVAALHETTLGAISNTKDAIRKLIVPVFSLPICPSNFTVRQKQINTDELAILMTRNDLPDIYLCKATDGPEHDILAVRINCKTLLDDCHVIQAEFLEDSTILLLLQGEKQRVMATISWSSMKFEKIRLRNGEDNIYDVMKAKQPVHAEALAIREFDCSFSPAKVAVSLQRNVGCILDDDNKRYIFFDLASDEDDDED